jgi:predicted DNA-binding transcriptional regulator AlpA
MAKAVTVDKLLYTPVEAAHALGLSRSTIYVF